jgi:hypothetical protein
MVEKCESLEKKIDQLDAKVTKTPGSIIEQYDLTVFNQKMMFDKLWAKVDRQEALLRRVVGFGQTLQDIAYIQTETASDVKLLLGEIDFGDENAQHDGQEERIGAGPEPETLGPAEITQHSISGPETLGLDDMERVAQGQTMGETSAAPIIPPSPDVTMTSATPINSQDDVQQTTTLVTSTGDHPPPLIANPGLPRPNADFISTDELLPPMLGNPGLPPSIADPTSTGDNLYRSVANAGLPPLIPDGPDLLEKAVVSGPGVTPPPANAAPAASPAVSPPPTKQVTADEPTRSDAEGNLLPPPANVHLSLPASVEEENGKGKKKKGRPPKIQDRRSPRLRGNSRAATPAAGGSVKRPADDDEGGDIKRKKAKIS